MIKQCAIIFGCLFFGELIVYFSGIKIPASIIGMLLLTSLLLMKIIKLDDVKEVSNFFVKHMGFFFIPPGVAIMVYYTLFKNELVAILLSAIISTLVVFAVVGWVYQKMMKQNE